jgi:hypothetical protein
MNIFCENQALFGVLPGDFSILTLEISGWDYNKKVFT